MDKLLTCLLLFTPMLANAICLNPFGCEPKSYDECATDATKRPTEAGVRFAIAQCYAKFKKPEEERQRAEEAAAAQQFAQLWLTAWNQKRDSPITMDSVEDVFGKALRFVGPLKCSGKSTTIEMCKTFYWADLTKSPEDFSNLGLGKRQPAFYAEFLVTGRLWHRATESVAIFR